MYEINREHHSNYDATNKVVSVYVQYLMSYAEDMSFLLQSHQIKVQLLESPKFLTLHVGYLLN